MNAAADSENLSGRAIIAGVAGFFGATGILAVFGFLVQEAQFLMIGLPYPPFATTDYFRLAGLFLFDVLVLVILLNGVVWGVILALAIISLIAVGVWLCPPPTSTWTAFTTRYAACWRMIRSFYSWMQGRIGLACCMVLLVMFTFYYHYPVFAQRYVTNKLELCGTPPDAPLDIRPVVDLWRIIDCRRSEIRTMLLDQEKLFNTQAIYRDGVLLLLVLTLYAAYHPYNQLTVAGRQASPGKRWLWSTTGLLLLLSFVYLPGGYAVLFRDKQAPVVHITFKATEQGPWQDSIMNKGWFLLFQSDKEMWLFRWPTTLIVQKEQLSTVEIGSRHWIFQAQ
jgi:hypothetical protein